MKSFTYVLVLSLALAAGGCGALGEALTGHARPAATAAGHSLSPNDLGQLMASSPIPDSAVNQYWAGELARLWADFVVLATLYQDPDTTRSVDYSRLLEDGRHLAAIAVLRYRDSVVMAGVDPTEEEMRAYFEVRQPYTRLDVRRVALEIPEGASPAARDSLLAEARALRDRLVGGADFVTVARERSHEPLQARGQVLAYQGHDDFPIAADSVVFGLQPGEISPVIVAGRELLIYRIEERRAPDYETARDQLRRLIVAERQEARQAESLDAAVGDARRAVLQGAPEIAIQVASDPSLGAGSIPGGMKLVSWEGGDLSVEELRRLFLVRDDMRKVFTEASRDEVQDYLMRLARDEILITEAARSGATASPEERESLAIALADQLGHIAARLGLTSQLVNNPRFDLDEQGYYFLQGVMTRSQAIPWLGEFRVVLDPQFPVRVDESGVRSAVRHATELRAAGLVTPPPENGTPHGEEGETRVEVG